MKLGSHRVIIAIFVAIFALSCHDNLHLRKDETKLRSDILTMLPENCTTGEAKQVFVDLGYKLETMNENLAYKNNDQRIGDSHFVVILGHYQGIPFQVWVSAAVVFDEDGRLLDVFVKKDEDSM